MPRYRLPFSKRSEEYKEHRRQIVRRSIYKAKYGLTSEQVDELERRTKGRCAICRQRSNKARLHIDHCHRTGKIRGMLCFNCNSAIGHLREDPKIFKAAMAYLERNS